jgi:decaprenyl-phosphate phosphoribosyltransferase
VIELFAVASGFVLRAIAGAEAVDVDASVWFVLAVSFAALFVVIGKRLSEALEFGDEAARQRATTEAYPSAFLRSSLAIAASASIVVYCLWAFEASNVVGSGILLIELSIVPVSAALLRYLLLVELGSGGAPEEVFLSDRSLQVLGVVWLLLFGLGVYLR